MSSLATSSPVSASTFMYLMRWPVFLLSWLNEIFSDSDVAGYSATGQVTSEKRRKPFQLARGAMIRRTPLGLGFKTNGGHWFRHLVPTERDFFCELNSHDGLDICSCYVLIRHDRPTRELAHADTQTNGKTGRRNRPAASGPRCGSRGAPSC